MAYVDNYSQSALGEKINTGGKVEEYVANATVTKGQVLAFTAAALDLPTVGPAGAASTTPAGVALNSAVSGGAVSVARNGCVVKVRVGAGVPTAGDLLITAATGYVDTWAATTMNKIIGRALQTALTAGDDILILVGGMI